MIVVETTDEARILSLLDNAAATVRQTMYRWNIADGLVTGTNTAAGPGGNLEPTEVLLTLWNMKSPGIFVLVDFHPFMAEPRNVRLIKEIAQGAAKYRQTLVFVSYKFDIPDELSIFSARFELRLPTDDEILQLINGIAFRWSANNRTPPMIISDEIKTMLLKNLRGLSIQEVDHILQKNLTTQEITRDQIDDVLKAKYELLNKEGVLYYEHDTARFNDVGGVANLKKWLQQRQPIFLGEKVVPGIDMPKGILLLGIQGSGKSLAAKAVAGSWGVPLLRLDFGALYDKYIGETERKTRESLKMAERMAPCVLWFDEIEKGISLEDNDGGTSRRILSTLLTWIAERKSAVFMVATANDIQSLPPELMRKGRFDEIFFVDLPDPDTRKVIFSIHLKKRGLDPDKFDFAKLLPASEGFSGSEIEQAVVSGLYSCVGGSGVLTNDILLNALQATKPLSVVMAEQIDALREWAKDRTVMA
jgi:SpoVK/Ycf46/Vps4 family AAA+-type ATPase